MDQISLVKAFAYSLGQYNPHRVNRGMGRDAFWQFVDVADRIGFVDDEFFKAVRVSRECVDRWKSEYAIPGNDERDAAMAHFKVRANRVLGL